MGSKTSIGLKIFVLVLNLVGCCTGITYDVQANRRMVGGKIVESTADWGFAIYLNFRQPKPKFKICSGVLISREWALTAARCVFSIRNQPKFLTVGVGKFSRLQVQGEHNYTVSRIVVHPALLFPQRKELLCHDYDVALLKLSHPVKKDIEFVTLPDENEEILEHEDYQCKTAGWGKVDQKKGLQDFKKSGYSISDKLREINVKLTTREECKKSLNLPKKVCGDSADAPRVLCTQTSPLSTEAPCYGDSGSPLVCQVNDVRKLYGIILGVDAYCNPKRDPANITELSKYVEWIKSVAAIPGN